VTDFDREHDTGAHRALPVRRRAAQEPEKPTAKPATCERRRTGRRRPRLRNAQPRLRDAGRRLANGRPRLRNATSARPRRPAGAGAGAGTRLRLTPLLHASFFVAAATQSAIVPLLPRLSHAYGLSPSAGALLLAAPGLATLAVSMPAGVLADRLGARRVTIAATFLLSAAALAQAAPSYMVLVAGRLAFGLAYGIVWTAGVAWLSSSHGEAGSPRLGAVATSAAVGMVAGPGIGGIVADVLGLSAPFLLVAGLAVVLALLLSRQPDVARRVHTAASPSLRSFIRIAPRRPGVLTGAAVLAIGGAVGGVTQLLVPLQLHQAGFSASGTGVAFSAAAGLYIVVSASVIRLGRRATAPRAAALAGLALALSLLPGVFGLGAVGLVGMLLLSTMPRAFVSTVSYPLATESAASAELPDGVVIGLLNGAWAIGLVLAPLIAGAIDQLAGPAPAYLTAVLPGSIGALWLLARRTATKPETEPDSTPAQADGNGPPTVEHELAAIPA
jgi:predicted MFS family arabinose efflux permease